ncbi:MAG: PTS glucose transporter subunit IIA [Lachnospiraceae bacterium]|nr:PTS glucose transporter subunit IIA [Lachnospiraceae bacterium]
MFHFSVKKKNCIISPVSGRFLDITEVSDETFSSKLMGDGIAVIPKDNVIKAPCDGTITMLFRTYHALGITMKDGTELLIHIGIDTVNLNGKGFSAFKKENDKIRAGEPLIRFDEGYLDDKNLDMTTMVILSGANADSWKKCSASDLVQAGDPIFERI